LLYQVATARLAPGDIAAPIRQLLRKQRNVTVAMAEVTGVDVRNRRVLVNYLGQTDTPFEYDYLILATGVSHSYFGHNEFAPFAPGMKRLADAESVRAKVLKAFETAEIEKDPSKHQDPPTFVLVGARLTGVEMAGSLSELRRFTMKSDFRRIDPIGFSGYAFLPPPDEVDGETGWDSFVEQYWGPRAVGTPIRKPEHANDLRLHWSYEANSFAPLRAKDGPTPA
jgi:NADH dehydrogenase FAD-containing subunit